MRHRLLALVLLVAAAGCADSVTAPLAPADSGSANAVGDGPRTIVVSEGWDSGPGTLRAAMEEASADPEVVGIRIEPWVYQIEVYTPLTFTGTQPLTIDGGEISVYGRYVDGAIFDVRVRSAITLTNMFIVGSLGAGVRVVVPEDATGTVRVTLHRVLLSGHNGHGLLVNDLPAYLDDPNTTSTAGSPASLRVEVTGMHFGQIGQGRWNYDGTPLPAIPDSDGIRINEGGDGNVVVILGTLQMAQAGHDAVHVDERGKGSIDLRFETSTVSESGWASPTERGNGVRLDESGAGELKAYLNDVSLTANGAQALRFIESGTGHLTANLVLTNVSGHAADAVVLVEDAVGTGGGNLTLDITDSRLTANGQDLLGTPALGTANVIVHERLGGSLTSRVTRTVVAGGLYGGMSHREDGGGSLNATISASTFSQLAHFGLSFDENGAGDLLAAITGGSVSYNGTVGIRVEQAPAGVGRLTLTGVDLQANGTGAQHVQVRSGQVTVVSTP